MNSLIPLLTWRYIRGAYQTSSISTMVLVCFLGIFIGSGALALVVFVMDGFEHATSKKLQGIHAQLTMRDYQNQPLDHKKISAVLQREFPEVIGISPIMQHYVLTQPTTEDEPFALIMLQGILPHQELGVSSLEETIIATQRNTKKLADALDDSMVLVGEQFINDHQLSLGDNLELMIPEPRTNNTMRFDTHNTRIGGIFKTGIDDFDAHVFFCSLDYLKQLIPDAGIHAISLRLADHVSEQTIIQKLRTRFGLNVYSWKELYPALLSALTLEKYLMFFVLALITLVASMSMVSLLFMLITQKKAEIALLRSMGCSVTTIKLLFITIGVMIAFSASISGLACAVLLGYVLERYQLIVLPDAYYVSHLPAHITWSSCVVVFSVVIALSFFASWFATRTIGTWSISHVLRHEG